MIPSPQSDAASPTVKPPPGTPPFLAALYAYPLLTRPQEHHLFRKMNFLKFQADAFRNQLSSKHSQRSSLNRIERLLQEATDIRNEIVRANLRLVVSIAKKLVDAANTFDDLVGDGIAPLIRAAEIFDFDRGTRFSTYATWSIRNSLYRSTARNRKFLGRFRTCGDAVFESAAEHRSSVRASEAYHRDLRDTFRRGLAELDSRDRKIVIARFALEGNGRPQRFREIAAELNISTERVRQLLARSLERLKETVEPETRSRDRS